VRQAICGAGACDDRSLCRAAVAGGGVRIDPTATIIQIIRRSVDRADADAGNRLAAIDWRRDN